MRTDSRHLLRATAVRRLGSARAVVIVAIVTLVAGCGGGDAVELTPDLLPEDVVCVVEGRSITFDDLANQVSLLARAEGSSTRGPTRGTPVELRQNALRSLADIVSMEATLEDAGFAPIDRAVIYDEIKRQALDLVPGMTRDELELSVRSELVRDKAFEHVTARSMDSTPLPARGADVALAPHRKIQRILVKTKAQARRVALAAQGMDQAQFTKLADTWSTELEGSRGTVIEAPFADAAPGTWLADMRELEVGETSGAVVTPLGWTIVRAAGPVEPGRKPTASETAWRVWDDYRVASQARINSSVVCADDYTLAPPLSREKKG